MNKLAYLKIAIGLNENIVQNVSYVLSSKYNDLIYIYIYIYI